MLKIFRVIILVIIGAGISVEGRSQAYEENSIFWRVTGKDLKKPSYIFAIVEFIQEADYFMPPLVLLKLDQCDILSTETLLDQHTKHELNKAAHLNDQSIEEFLTDQEYKKLEKLFIKELDVSRLKFNMVYKRFKPIMLSTTITMLHFGDRIKYYEQELVNLAKEKGMITLGLESVEREVEALEKFPVEEQVAPLKQTLANVDKQLDNYQNLVRAYKQGDMRKSLEYIMHPVENNKMYKEYYIIERNKEWIPKMVNYMQEAPTFFALGVSHLAHEYGILSLLTQEGYTVTPIKGVMKQKERIDAQNE